jgi:hypothetical protein
MPLPKARRTELSGRAGRPDGVIYRQLYVRCGKAGCRRCPPAAPGHGPYCVRLLLGLPPAHEKLLRRQVPATRRRTARCHAFTRDTRRGGRDARSHAVRVIHSARTGDRLWKCRRARARLGQPFGLPTFPQTDDALASLAVYHSSTSHSGQSDAGFAVPVLSRLNSTSCPTFIPAFTPTRGIWAV